MGDDKPFSYNRYLDTFLAISSGVTARGEHEKAMLRLILFLESLAVRSPFYLAGFFITKSLISLNTATTSFSLWEIPVNTKAYLKPGQ